MESTKKKFYIRFLKAGYFELEVDHALTTDQVLYIAQNALHDMSDSQIISAMADFTEKETKLTGSLFDEDSLIVEAIYDKDFEPIYETELWQCFAYGEPHR